MKLKEKTYQNRRDFKAIYKCEKCGSEVKKDGYDDANFHENVTPKWECNECGESSESLGVENFVSTKYPEGFQI